MNTDTKKKPFFSVLIPTRNRPKIMLDALNSVLSQHYDSFEVIIINDGSEEKHKSEYIKSIAPYKGKVTLLTLEQSINGHGPSYALNMGVNIAKGAYIAFLDDDDIWTSTNHLHDAQDALTNFQADIYLSLQKAYKNDEALKDEIWLTPLIKTLNIDKRIIDISIEKLILSNGFSHRNNLIVSKDLYLSINGHDENLRYEEDREFYFRAIEQANKILFNPSFISRHNIPNNKITNLSSSASTVNKQLSRLYLLDKIFVHSRNIHIQKHIELHKVYTLKALSEEFFNEKQYLLASHYAKQVLLIKFNLKWAVFSTFVTIMNIFTNFKWEIS